MPECKEKWRNIRGRYLRQLKDVPPSGSGTKRKKLYYLTDYLHFIDPYTSSRSQTGNLTLSGNNVDYSEVDVENDDENESKEGIMPPTQTCNIKSNRSSSIKSGKDS